MQKIALVQCVNKKQQGEHPAKDLYKSAYFNKMKTYVEKHCDNWYILSAEYNLIKPDSIVKSYNKTLNRMKESEVAAWAQKTVAQIKQEVPIDGTQLEFHAGARYGKELHKLLSDMGYNIAVDPRSGMRIGERLKWYNKNT